MDNNNYPKYGDPNFSFIEDMKRRFGNAKDIMLEPPEQLPEGDYSMLPNEYMSGQGLGKMFRAYQSLMPDPVKITPSPDEISKMNPQMQKIYKDLPDMYMDPMSVVGSMKFPKIGKTIKSPAKPPTPMIDRYGSAIGNELPADMSLIDRIKLAKERSGPIRQVETFEQAANSQEMQRLKNLPKNYFEKASQKASENAIKRNEESMQKILELYKDDPEKFEALKKLMEGGE